MSSTGLQLVVFSLGNELYGLPIDRVQEIIRYEAPRSIISNDPTVRGVLNLRGHLVPVHDIAGRLGVCGGTADGANIMILETGDTTVGVVVDSVEEVLTTGPEALEDLPAADSGLARSLVRHEDRLIVLLEAAAIVPAFATAA